MTANGTTPAAPLAPEQKFVPVKGAALALGLLLGINLFNYIDRQVLAANVTHIEKQLLPEGDAANKEKLGYLAMAFMVSYMVFAPLFGWLADRVPRWRLVGIGVILWSLASGASGLVGTFSGTFLLLLATRCFVGVGEAAYGPVAPAIISDLYPVKVRGSVLAWFYVAIPVGSALGYTLGGMAGWPGSFYWVVPPGLLLGVWCFFMPEPPRGQADLADPKAARRRGSLKDYLILFRTPSYVLDTLGMMAMTFALGGIGYFMPDFIHVYRGVDDLEAINFRFGLIVVVAGLTATLLGGIVGDKLRPYASGSYFLVSGIAMLIGFPLFLAVLSLSFHTAIPWAWMLIFLTCFCLFFNTGPTNTILANVTHPALRAPGFALNIFIIHAFGDAISPTIIGRIAKIYAKGDKPNMDAGFLAVSIMILVGGVFWLLGTPFLARDTALAAKRFEEAGGPAPAEG